jgi:diadenosine tetraphosphate (Ap4A) HIT family hydrolase
MSAAAASDCPFCSMPEKRLREQNEHGFVVDDAFPVSPGHTLVIARRHTSSVFDLTADELASLLRLLDAARRRLDQSVRPAGYNLGVNVGAVAGQTIGHVHLHLIPRYPGDSPDPTGGVRNVIAGKGRCQPASDSGKG